MIERIQTKVAVLCDYPIVGESVARMLQATGRFDVTCGALHLGLGPAFAQSDLVLCVCEATCQVAVILQRVRESVPAAKLACLILGDDDDAVLAALRAGATGIIDNTLSTASNPNDLADRIERIARGEFVLPASLAMRLARMHVHGNARDQAPSRVEALTGREQEVLSLLADGHTNREIAAALCLSEHTVRAHMRGIMQKLQAASRVQAVAIAWKENLIASKAREVSNGYSRG